MNLLLALLRRDFCKSLHDVIWPLFRVWSRAVCVRHQAACWNIRRASVLGLRLSKPLPVFGFHRPGFLILWRLFFRPARRQTGIFYIHYRSQ